MQELRNQRNQKSLNDDLSSSFKSQESSFSQQKLVEIRISNRFRKPGCLVGIFLKYFIFKRLSLYNCLILMFLSDLILLTITSLTLIPLFQIDKGKVDPQVVIAILKLFFLLLSEKFLTSMLCMRKIKSKSKSVYIARMLILVTVIV